MATLNIVQMYALARKAGLPAGKATIAAAIGMAESGGRTGVTSSNPDGGTNVGVWQLDTPGGAGHGYSVAQLSDPGTNAKVMAAASNKGQNFGAWQTYAQGTYHQFMDQATAAAGQESGGGSGWIGDVLGDVKGAAGAGAGVVGGFVGNLISLPSQVTGFLGALEEPVQKIMWIVNPGNWARILAGVFGFVLLGMGLFTLMKAA